MRRYPTHGFGRNTHYHRRPPRPADQRHHGWYVLAPLRPAGHGGCANGGQPRRRSSDSGNPRSAVQGQLRHCLDRRLERPTRPRSTCRYATPMPAAGYAPKPARCCWTRTVPGTRTRRMPHGAATGTSAPFPPSLPSPPVPRRCPFTRAVLRHHHPATPHPPVRRLEQTSVRTVAEMVCGEVPFEAIVMTRTELRRDWQRNRCSCCAAYSS